MIVAAWAAFRASKAFGPVLGALAILLVLGLVFGLGRCSKDDHAVQAQIEQGNRTNAALSTAAEMAVDKVEDRAVTEDAIDAALAATTREIEDADDVDAVRGAVIASVCRQAAHRNDPACRLHETHP